MRNLELYTEDKSTSIIVKAICKQHFSTLRLTIKDSDSKNNYESSMGNSDLIILDSTEALLYLAEHKKSKPFHYTKFIVVSETADLITAAFRLGAINYILKPISPNELKSAITYALATIDREKIFKELLHSQ